MKEMAKPLPQLGSTPSRHPDCCLSLSTTLCDRIIATTSAESTGGGDDGTRSILSIGSGSGLLEYLLNLHADNVDPHGSFLAEGVEVQQPESQPSVNTYLPEPRYHTVQRTSMISPRIYDDGVRALMFVYPRQPSLVKQYLEELEAGKTHIDTVIWLGPRADWDDFSPCFDNKSSSQSRKFNSPEITILSAEKAGLDDYEVMAIVRLHRGVDP